MPVPGKTTQKLPPHLQEFLTQLSVALHKYRAYPSGHPMRVESTRGIHRLLEAILGDQPSLRIAVARRHLLLNDQASEESQPVLRELAERLHRRQIGAILLFRGISLDELEAALERMNVDPRRVAAIGEAVRPERVGTHVEVLPMSYAHLIMAEDGRPVAVGATSAAELWEELARITAAPSSGLSEGGVHALAAAVRAFSGDRNQRTEMVTTLERFGRAAVREAGASGALARRVLSELLRDIPSAELATLLGIDLASPEGRRRLTTASEWMALPALVDLVQSAAEASGQSVSHFLLRLLRKLGHRPPDALEPDSELAGDARSTIQDLLKGWSLEDPNPTLHTELLEMLSRRDRSGSALAEGHSAESERVVRIALEVGSGGALVLAAVDEMLEAGHLPLLLDLLDVAAADEASADIGAHLVSASTLRRVLLEEPIDQGACARLLARVPIESADGLLDSLTISESQGTRWLILRRLAELGPAVGDLLVTRLDAAPWYLKRNLLGLLADLPVLPAGFSARRYADDPEPLLRLEALRLMFRSPEERDEGMNRALSDADDRAVRIGLEAGAEHGLPRASLPRLMKFLNDDSHSAELRARGVALLGQFESPTIRQWLLERILVRRGFFRRTRLAPKSPDMLAGLGVLAHKFRGHPQTAEVLRRATASGDPDIMSAVAEWGPV